MSGYWKDFEKMRIGYSFEAYDERSGFSDGETFDSLQDAIDAFNSWQLDEGEAASAKRVCVDVYVPTERGEYDIFETFTAIEERI